ncbi:MAG: hypothetical protein UR52_C0008G0014 [Candidatus Gottesmanbacteria bacterium GW2011_GWA1_34_13]|uniref:Uncharacterized protein n=1 Tax=Candidatus Gottesmanbacteria bacterium GW2011_GWA1_34_13 TaxID=1618434 RepID=A0A0G0AR13_9BACT|nr:MAG: hypothetical protein UR52_C0008G0014 [Candidatus Gottesmanbacteria bacterium GW2011_GWA1_34_13]
MNFEKQVTLTDGKKVLLRYPQIQDVVKLQQYINTLSQEDTYLLVSGETFSQEEEQKYLNDALKLMKDKNKIQILAFHNEQIIGNVEVNRAFKIIFMINITEMQYNPNNSYNEDTVIRCLFPEDTSFQRQVIYKGQIIAIAVGSMELDLFRKYNNPGKNNNNFRDLGQRKTSIILMSSERKIIEVFPFTNELEEKAKQIKEAEWLTAKNLVAAQWLIENQIVQPIIDPKQKK